ncbi:MAG: helix-turn-helix domain-containing protein [Planctomycetota bacterium]
MPRKLSHINRRLSRAERDTHARIREAAAIDFPPKTTGRQKRPLGGIPARIRAAREAQGLTWYALAKRAGIRNQATVRDLEQGKDVRLSNLERVARALGLSLELVG